MNKDQDIINLLHKYNLGGKLGGDNISIRCPLARFTPLHKNNFDSRPSMGIKVQEESVLVNCFTCQFKSGQLSYLFRRLAHFDSSWESALNDCLEIEKKSLESSLSNASYNKVYRKPKRIEPFDESLYLPYSRKFSPYLNTRGIELETGKRFDVGYDGKAKRVLIPVRDPSRRLWGAVGRTIANENPKYMNYWKMSKGQHLLGSHLVESGTSIIVVEGALDCMKVDQALYRNGLYGKYRCVALMGASMTSNQADKLVNWGSSIVLALDGDQAGYNGTKKALKLLSNRITTRVGYIYKTGKNDFGECSEEEILSVVDKSEFIL